MSLDKRTAAVQAIRARLRAAVAALPVDADGDDAAALMRAYGQSGRMLDGCPVGGAMHAYLQPHGGTP